MESVENNNVWGNLQPLRLIPEMVKSIGDALYLSVDDYKLPSILLITIPGCPMCARVENLVAAVRQRTPCLVFVLQLGNDNDLFSDCWQLEMGMSTFPTIYIGSRRKHKPLIPNFLPYTEDDINGVKRLTVESLEVMLQSQVSTSSQRKVLAKMPRQLSLSSDKDKPLDLQTP